MRMNIDNLSGWKLDIINCIRVINKPVFTLEELYDFERVLMRKHPENQEVKAKIRQQIQFLRNQGYLEFIGNGVYKLVEDNE